MDNLNKKMAKPAMAKKRATKAPAAPAVAAPMCDCEKPQPAPSPVAPVSAPKPVAKSVAKGAAGLEQKKRMIDEAAYYLAQKDGFRADPHSYWMEAEKQVSKQIAEGKL